MPWRDGTSAARTPADLDTAAAVTGSGSALPTLPDAVAYPAGALFVRTSDFTVWRSAGSTWAEVSASPAQRPYGPDHGVIAVGTVIGANNIRLVRYTVEKTGSWTGITVYLTATSGNCVAGVYDTTVTNLAKLADTASVACGTANTWQTGLDFSTPINVVAGQQVLVALHVDNGTVAHGRTGNPTNNAVAGPLPTGYLADADASNLLMANFSRGTYSSPLPSTLSVASLTANGSAFVFYCKYA